MRKEKYEIKREKQEQATKLEQERWKREENGLRKMTAETGVERRSGRDRARDERGE